MKAVIFQKYGSPDVMNLKEVQKPVPGDDDVLVKINATCVNAGDWHLLRGKPFPVRLFFGLTKPKFQILGADIAGTLEAVGTNVREFGPGDEVFGNVSEYGFGGFAEYVAVPENTLAAKPAGMTFEEAAAVPQAAVTALQGLRDFGKIQAGQSVLINGASGGVGTFAVQIAKSFGAEVTGVCSSRNVEMVRSIGADHVIDYTKEDFTKGELRYDLILDAAAFRSMFNYRRALDPEGIYVLVGGDRIFEAMLLGPLVSMLGKKKMVNMLHKPTQEDLIVLKELVEAGKVRPVIDRKYTLSEVPEAVRYQEEGHTQGKVVITME